MHRTSNYCWKYLLVFAWCLSRGTPTFSQQPKSPLLDSFDSYQRMKSETVYGLEWISVGPVVNSARVEAVQLDPSLPGLIYVAFDYANIYVNPTDDDEIFALGVRVAHSTDGGQNFDLLSGHGAHKIPSAASGLHLDHCEMWINPTNPNHIVLVNDGGLYQSFDTGASWVHFNNLPTGEFYDVAVSQDSPYRIYAGAQDNATVVVRPKSASLQCFGYRDLGTRARPDCGDAWSWDLQNEPVADSRAIQSHASITIKRLLVSDSSGRKALPQ